MNKYRNLLVLLISIVILASCGEKKETNENSKVSNKENINSVSETTDISIIGYWVTEKKGRWLEFLNDGTLNMGMDGKDDVSGRKYEVDLNKNIITVETKKATKIFQFRRKGNDLFIKVDGNDKELKYSLKEV